MTNYKAEVLSLIDANEYICIFGHALPDGDCYGCQIGLREIIKEAYPSKHVYAVGSGIPRFFDVISPMDEVDETIIKKSLGILVDVSCLRRVEDPRVSLCKDITKFDHHCHNPEVEVYEYPTYWVDENRIACAEMIADFALEFNLPINKTAANALYLGLLTDSGNFIYYGTTQHSRDIASLLIEKGANHDLLFDLYYEEDEATKKFRKYLGSKIIEDGLVAYVYISEKEYLSQGMNYEKACDMVNALPPFTDKPIYCLFTQQPDGQIKGEFRSNHGYPVQPTAVLFGGGGHRFASGVVIKDEEQIKTCIKELNKVRKVQL